MTREAQPNFFQGLQRAREREHPPPARWTRARAIRGHGCGSRGNMARESQPDGNWERHRVAVTGRRAPEPGVRRYRATAWASRV